MGDCIARHVKLISLPLLINSSGLPRIFARDTFETNKREKEKKKELNNEKMKIS